ncbi:MAG: metal-dependent transcriptional regulator [Aerococcus sp.]|nr:metal-dependent transcriptional regulator [Aerococcus sp.]
MSRSKDDYMKVIAELGGMTRRVPNKVIHDTLNVSAASVTEMINRLQDEGLVENVPYQGVQLTETGCHFAAQVIRRHRLWEVFLYDKLGYAWEDVHEEAEDLEHHASDEFMDRLDVYLDSPQYCPHGGVIPSKNGDLPTVSNQTLEELPEGDDFLLVRVPDEKTCLQEVDHLQLHLQHCYQLKHKGNEQFVVADGQREINIPEAMIAKLFILPL